MTYLRKRFAHSWPTTNRPFIFESLNPSGTRTLLLLHGTLSSHQEFYLLLSRPNLQNYHILLPDLPRHGLSSTLNVPFTLPEIAALLADLIKTYAKNGKADIVASDIGRYSALYLASKYSDLVSSVFATGCDPDHSSIVYSSWMAIKTYLGAVIGLILVPRSWTFSVAKKLDMDFNDKLVANMEKTLSLSYVGSLFWMLNRGWGNGESICKSVNVRTLMIAAGRQDAIEGVRERGEWLRKGDPDSKAVVVNGARHAWICQVGKVDLFPEGVRAWIENVPLPVEYEVLDGSN